MSNRKICVIGIDGATFNIIDPLVKEGRLPHFARFISNGVSGTLQSSIPAVSPVAWTTFMTGMNPGKHQIFDFPGKQQGCYEFKLNTASDRKAPPFWMQLSEVSKRVFIAGVTLTYPPDPVNGYMISGLGAPTDSKSASFTHPPALAEEITGKLGAYRTVPDANMRSLSRSDAEKNRFLKGIREQAEYRTRLFKYMWQKEAFDFSMIFFLDTDGVSHYFWRHMDRSHSQYQPGPYSDAIFGVYEIVDRAIGELLSVIKDDADIVMVSDHGFGPLNRVVFLNNWLESQAYLKFKRTAGITKLLSTLKSILKRSGKRQVSIHWQETKAYFIGTVGNLFINLKGREAEGAVDETEYAILCEELKCALLDMQDPETGKNVVDHVYKRDEAFNGTSAFGAPDLVVIFKRGYDVVGEQLALHNIKDTGEVITDSNNWSGTHEPAGVLIAHGRSFKQGHRIEGANIVDMAPTILYASGVPIPRHMDGKPLVGMFTDDFARSHPVMYDKETDTPAEPPAGRSEGYQQRESDEVLKRLRNLGYVD